MFAELHSHSEYSNLKFLDVFSKISDLINEAHDRGFSGIAITDHECISGHIQAIEINKKIKEKNPNFKVILGNEIYLIDTLEKTEKKRYYHFILLAKDKVGHKYLRELSSLAWKQSFYDRKQERTPTLKTDVENIVKEKGHLIASTACLGSEFATLVRKYLISQDPNDREPIDDFINWCINVFGIDNFYIELQAGITQEQVDYNKKAIQIAKYYGLNWIVTNDVHYFKKQDRMIHEAYLKSREDERETGDFYEATYFKTEDEMLERLSYLDKEDVLKAFENTVDICNKVEFFDLKQDVVIPTLKLGAFNVKGIFEKWYDKYPNIAYFANSPHEQDRYLMYQIEKGFLYLEEEFNEENLSRIDIELEQKKEISDKLNQRLSAYYTLVQKVIDIMWDDNLGNSIVPPGRGSTCGWYVSYLLGISQIKPMEHNLPWWRHVHKTKVELSDIDIDSEQSKRQGIFDALKTFFGEDNVLNICTFKTEGTKSAILTACRGLGIDNDTAQELADFIPSERGKLWTFDDCLNGNEEKGRISIKQLIDKMNEFPLLIDTVKKIEGVICGRSIHASGVYIFADGYIEQNSLMKAPNGKNITCWNMNDSDLVGALKIDCLTIAGADKIRKTMELLINDGKIEWQGTLRATYNKYLHPRVLEYKAPKLWDLLCDGNIIDLFQFDTTVGVQAIKNVQPRNLQQMMSANALMRLMPEDGMENPIERYVRFKNNINQWYKEMTDYGLTKEEQDILNKYLIHSFGVCAEQEDLMELSMAEEVANFTFPQANAFKSGVAKKKESKIIEAKEWFYNQGRDNGNRDIFLNYIWDYCFKPQFGYSFSRNHDCPYSVIGVQEMNLVYRYGQLYWNTACLTINASANEDNDDNKSTDYGSIAKAIGEMQSRGISITLPDINKAMFSFTPDFASNSIVFGLKGITNIGDDVAYSIVNNRPYNSMLDFLNKIDIKKVAMIYLIKGGAFDALENKPRTEIMNDYFNWLVSKEIENKTSLNMQNMNKIVEYDIVDEVDTRYIRYYNFNKYITNKDFFVHKEGKKNFYIAKDKAFNYFEENYVPHLIENVDYYYSSDGIVFCKNSYDKVYKKRQEEFIKIINNPNMINKYNNTARQLFVEDIVEKYCKGSISKWEMSALNFYYTSHELANVDRAKYNITDFNDIPEEPIIEGETTRGNKTFPKYKLFKIVGTVLEKNKHKHIVTLLTTNGVISVKFYEGAFIHYSKRISRNNEEGKKVVLEEPWIERGNLLMICGIRREDKFFPKKYYDSIYKHSVVLIEDVINNGRDLILKHERDKYE
jgi:DNA polymerase-3 subunit alpha